MKRTNTVADALNTNIAKVDPGDGLPVIPIPLDGKMPGYPGPPGPGVPEGGTTGQTIEKTSDGSTQWVTLTKSKFNLGNVDNTSDLNKPISSATQTALDAKASNIELSAKADLVSGKIPVAQIPVEATVTDLNVSAQVDAPLTGAAIDQRINIQVTPVVEQITADYIAGDQAVIDAAAAAVDANPTIAAIEARELPDRGRLLPASYPGGIITVTTYGVYSVYTGPDATALGLPLAAAAEVHVYGFGNSMTYRVISFTSAGTVENLRRSSSGVWVGDWARQTPSDAETANFIKNGVDTPREIQAMIDAAGGINTRLVPLSLTTGASSADAPAEGTVRYPIHFSPVIGRWRLRIVDVNPRYGSDRVGTSTLEHVLIGAHAGDGAFKVKPTLVAASATVAPGKTGWTSGWMDHQIGGSKQLVSLAYTSTGGVPCALPGAGWQGARSVAQELAPGLGAPQARMPFHVWIEAEVDSQVRVIAALGSSSSCGQGATYPVLESFVSQHARRVGALPVHYTAAGTTIEDWDLPTHYKWTMQDGYTTPDALIWNIGSNNIYGDAPLAGMVTSSGSLLGLLEDRGITHIYAANIPPRAATTPERTAVRLGYNDWMRTSGEFKDYFDFASALSTDGLVMDTEYDSGDGTHYNTAGHDATVPTITANMATAPLINA